MQDNSRGDSQLEGGFPSLEQFLSIEGGLKHIPIKVCNIATQLPPEVNNLSSRSQIVVVSLISLNSIALKYSIKSQLAARALAILQISYILQFFSLTFLPSFIFKRITQVQSCIGI
jgi:hypothetical protein